MKPIAIFNNKDPIVIGVDVEKGILKVGTPLCIYEENTTFSKMVAINN